jgi:tetratricopeptide (TPR) repeat protein/glycosyltransferase involved in cell wall biosynthesis
MNRQARRQLARQQGKAQRRLWDVDPVQGGILSVAIQHHEAGRLPQAEEIYRQILHTHPDHPEALHLSGLAAFQVGKHDEAVRSMGKAIAINPRAPRFHNNLGLALRAQGRLDEAVASLRRAVALEPDYAEAHNNLGVAFGDQGKLDEALASFRRALALKPDYAEATIGLGLTLAAQGKQQEAVESLRRALAERPDFAEAHNNLGILLKNQRKPDEAAESLRRALALKPDFAEAHNNLGIVLGERGEHDAAAESFRRALALKPDYAEAHNNLGCSQRDGGQRDAAVASFRQAVALKPDYAEAHNNLGLALREGGQRDAAEASFRRAVALKPDYAEALGNLGILLDELGKHDETVETLRSLVALRPDDADALNSLAMGLKNQRKLDEAAESLRRALALRPDFAEAHSNLGIVLGERGEHAEAVESLRRAVALKPDYAEAHSNLGVALRNQDELGEALASFRRAVAVKPDYADGYRNLGVVLGDLGALDEALASYWRAVEEKSDYADAYFGAALALLLKGDLEQGFSHYEWRWKCPQFASADRRFVQPCWDGGPLNGRTILLHAEQGLGDTLQFVRYAPLVAARGGRVVVECQAELAPLLQGLGGASQVVARGEPLPLFDLHAPLLSLPHLLGTTLETVPAEAPYLRAAPDRADAWAEYLDRAVEATGLRVGLVWAGNPDHKGDRHRSMSLGALAPLARVPGVQFVALQKGAGAAQAEAPPDGMTLTNLGPLLADFADTAAVLEQLDLVITVDTSVAHLAGALGRPVWVLLAFAPDWRWLRQRDDSPWYPTARLFRQERHGDWEGVLARVASALSEAASDGDRRGRTRPGISPRHQVRQSAADGRMKASATYVAVPLGGAHGWGICGKYLAKELALLGETRLVTDRLDADTVGDELDYELLKRIAHVGLTAPPDAAVLQSIMGRDLLPIRPTLRGAFTAGYTFFEENILPPAAIENAKRHYDLVVTGSTWCQEVLEAHGLRDVRTIIQGIDPTIFFPTNGDKEYFRDSFVVFSGGKLELRKGQDLVIRAYKALQDRHKDVMLVNSWFNGWEFSLNTMRASPFIRFNPTATDHVDKIAEVLADNGIDLDRVVTLRPRPNVTMGKVYRNTDVGLFPNRCEGGTNLVLMEYMACGKPAIASYNSGHRDVLHSLNAVLIRTMKPVVIEDHGRHSATWDEPDLEETIERLEWAYQHRESLSAIGQRAGEDLAQLTWKRTARQFSDLLKDGAARATPSDIRIVPVASSGWPPVSPNGSAGLHQAGDSHDGVDHVDHNGAGASELPRCFESLLAPLERSPEYRAISPRLAHRRPADTWHQDGLHFFAFELAAVGEGAVRPPEPPTAVFAMHLESQAVVSAVVVTPSSAGGEPEIMDLREPHQATASAGGP